MRGEFHWCGVKDPRKRDHGQCAYSSAQSEGHWVANVFRRKKDGALTVVVQDCRTHRKYWSPKTYPDYQAAKEAVERGILFLEQKENSRCSNFIE